MSRAVWLAVSSPVDGSDEGRRVGGARAHPGDTARPDARRWAVRGWKSCGLGEQVFAQVRSLLLIDPLLEISQSSAQLSSEFSLSHQHLIG